MGHTRHAIDMLQPLAEARRPQCALALLTRARLSEEVARREEGSEPLFPAWKARSGQSQQGRPRGGGPSSRSARSRRYSSASAARHGELPPPLAWAHARAEGGALREEAAGRASPDSHRADPAPLLSPQSAWRHRALDDYRAAVVADPGAGGGAAVQEWADTLLAATGPDEAWAQLSAAVQEVRTTGTARREQDVGRLVAQEGRMLALCGRHREARTALSLACSLAPRSELPWLYRASLRAAGAGGHSPQGASPSPAANVPGAVRDLRRALRLAPEHSDAHFTLARLLAGQGRVSEAEASLRAITLAQPTLLPAWVHLAALRLARTGDARGAAEAASRAHELCPTATLPLRLRAEALARCGSCGSAARDCARLARLDPEDGPAHLLRAQCLLREGRVRGRTPPPLPPAGRAASADPGSRRFSGPSSPSCSMSPARRRTLRRTRAGEGCVTARQRRMPCDRQWGFTGASRPTRRCCCLAGPETPCVPSTRRALRPRPRATRCCWPSRCCALETETARERRSSCPRGKNRCPLQCWCCRASATSSWTGSGTPGTASTSRSAPRRCRSLRCWAVAPARTSCARASWGAAPPRQACPRRPWGRPSWRRAASATFPPSLAGALAVWRPTSAGVRGGGRSLGGVPP